MLILIFQIILYQGSKLQKWILRLQMIICLILLGIHWEAKILIANNKKENLESGCDIKHLVVAIFVEFDKNII